MEFREERGIAVCGLACVLCSMEDCPGCAEKMANGDECGIGRCGTQKSPDGCHTCSDYPCGEDMLQGKRNRAFNHFAREFGKQALIDRLRINFENSVAYHRPDKTSGDYDMPETESEIFRLLRYGCNDPYAQTPVFETEHYRLRLIREEDTEDLIAAFQGDLSNWTFFGNKMHRKSFVAPTPTVEEMRHCIRSWLAAYADQYFVRFCVRDRVTGEIMGTVELFDHVGRGHAQQQLRQRAALHTDLSPAYETQAVLAELLALAEGAMAAAFGYSGLWIQALPQRLERLAALKAAGYELLVSETDRAYYYDKTIGQERYGT